MFRPVIVIAVASLLLGAGCSTPGDDLVGKAAASATPQRVAASTPSPQATPEGEGKPVKLQQTVIKTKQGQKWELQADTVDWMDNKSQAKAEEVTWFLLNPKGQREIKVVSVGADVDMDAETVVFSGEVVARRMDDSNESLVVQRLIYDGKERMFHGSDGVLWKRKGFELAGQTLTATSELDKVQLKGRVKGKTEGGLLKMDGLEPSEQRDR